MVNAFSIKTSNSSTICHQGSTSMTHATSRIYSMKCYKVVLLKEKEIADMPVNNNKTYIHYLVILGLISYTCT